MSISIAPEITSMPLARDIMQKTVINVFETMPVNEVARLLTDRRISGAPVVNDHGRVIGVISLFDLAAGRPRANQPAPAATKSAKPQYYGEVWFDYDQAAEYFGGFYEDEEATAGTAADLMSATLIEIPASATLTQIVELMLHEHVHRVLVTENEKVIGIVSTMDVLRFVPSLVELVRPILPAAE